MRALGKPHQRRRNYLMLGGSQPVLHLRTAPSSAATTVDEYVSRHDLTIRPEDHNPAMAGRRWSAVVRSSTAAGSPQRVDTFGGHSEELTASSVTPSPIATEGRMACRTCPISSSPRMSQTKEPENDRQWPQRSGPLTNDGSV